MKKYLAAALVLGAAFASVPAFAQNVPGSACPTGRQLAPLSAGGIGTAADSFGGPGPGYIGPTCGQPTSHVLFNYSSNMGSETRGTPSQAPSNRQLAPLSPGGIGTAASSFGGPGPGYIGPRQ
ncbi:MAG TPA: hypothetical protein VMQ54_09485 [Steroidobacteraceae bacterium]|nr:hypothetical protein [Steroidobacteraceae bacterium]